MPLDLENKISDFMGMVADGTVEIYNEFSLQHELGIFLRIYLPGWKVQFERNSSDFGISTDVKHEMDIAVFQDQGNQEKYAIELKFPLSRNLRYPLTMYDCIKDIRFIEELKKGRFDGGWCLTVVENTSKFLPLTGHHKEDGIYSYFRGGTPIHGSISNPLDNKESMIIGGQYTIDWKPAGNYSYYVLQI